MHRAVLCPDPSMMAQAEELASEMSLPIIIGGNDRLEGVSVNNEKVSVVLVPESHYVVLPDETVTSGIAWPIIYYNDFDDLSHGCLIIVETPDGSKEEAQRVIVEKHYARFFYRPLTTGSFSVTVYLNEEVKAEGGFFVC